MNSIIEYENGLKAVIAYIPGVRSVAAGFWVGVGSNAENKENNGISHFTEHMMFKGTDKLSPFDIANKFETYGANVNAFTSKECTCYYFKSVDEYAENCFSLLGDIMFDSVFPAVELDKERKVIVEEINMVEDSPEDICYDEIAYATYGDSGLGKTILGPSENVLRFTGDDVKDFMAHYYSPKNTVIAFSGNITEKAADKLIRKYILSRYKKDYAQTLPVKNRFNSRNYSEKIKNFEQSNIALSFPSLPFGDKDFTVQAALNVIVGGGMSSRLFQSVREQQGLAYSVYSVPNGYSDIGTLNVFLNISECNTERALTAVKKEIDLIKDKGITDEELERTKVQLKSALVFAEENVQTVMSSCGKLLLLKGELYDVDRKIAEIDAVTKEKANAFAREVFNYDKMNAAYVGKKTSVDILKIF